MTTCSLSVIFFLIASEINIFPHLAKGVVTCLGILPIYLLGSYAHFLL